MYIDRDSRGYFSINELTPQELQLLSEAIKAYVKCNFGYIPKATAAFILRFDNEIKTNEYETEK